MVGGVVECWCCCVLSDIKQLPHETMSKCIDRLTVFHIQHTCNDTQKPLSPEHESTNIQNKHLNPTSNPSPAADTQSTRTTRIGVEHEQGRDVPRGTPPPEVVDGTWRAGRCN